MTPDAPTRLTAHCITHGPAGVGLDAFPLRAPRADEALVETTLSCVSPGTELRELAALRAGPIDGPTAIPGYAKVGRIRLAAPGGPPVGRASSSRAPSRPART